MSRAETLSGMRSRSNDYWFTHPWVSSDVLIQFLFHKRPAQRGLEENINDNGVQYWTFPQDYPRRITDIINQTVETRKNP